MEGIINIYGVIGEMPDEQGNIIKPYVTFLDIARQVESQKEATSFDIVINSPGGYVEDGDEMIEYFEALKKRGVVLNTTTEVECASMATKIFLVGEKRVIRPGTEFMIHNPGVAPNHGDADYIEAFSKALRTMENDMMGYYHLRTGTSKEALKTLMKKETFLTPDQAVEFGFATEIQAKVELKAVAFSKEFNPNKSKMSKEKLSNEEVVTKLDSFLEKITALFKPNKATGLKVVLDGNAGEIEFPDLEADDTPSVGDKATIAGSPADGEHVMPSGETFVFAAGELTEIKPAEDEATEEVEALKAERDGLKEQLAAEALKTANALKEVTAMKKGVEEIKKEFKALKKDIGSNFSHDPKKKNFKEEGKTRSVWKDSK